LHPALTREPRAGAGGAAATPQDDPAQHKPISLSLTYTQFLDAIGRIAAVAFSGASFRSRFKSVKEKVEGFLDEVLGMYSDTWRERFSARATATLQPSGSKGEPITAAPGFCLSPACKAAVALPAASKALRLLFNYYRKTTTVKGLFDNIAAMTKVCGAPRVTSSLRVSFVDRSSASCNGHVCVCVPNAGCGRWRRCALCAGLQARAVEAVAEAHHRAVHGRASARGEGEVSRRQRRRRCGSTAGTLVAAGDHRLHQGHGVSSAEHRRQRCLESSRGATCRRHIGVEPEARAARRQSGVAAWRVVGVAVSQARGDDDGGGDGGGGWRCGRGCPGRPRPQRLVRVLLPRSHRGVVQPEAAGVARGCGGTSCCRCWRPTS
jgi:hypothetical protein